MGPWTCGTIAAAFLLFLSSREPIEYFFIITVAFYQVFIFVEKLVGNEDSGSSSIVYEFVGLWITLFGLPNGVDWLIAGVVDY